VKAFKDLKSYVKALEEKSTISHDEDIQELMNRQKPLEEIIEANSDAIKRIDAEILNIKNDKNDKEAEKKDKKCKYFDRGHCKYKTECTFSHKDKTGGSVTQKHAKQDTQRYVSGLNKDVDVEDTSVTTCMLLFLVMMDAKLMLTKVFLALDARIVVKM
jgi:hypothetical protein